MGVRLATGLALAGLASSHWELGERTQARKEYVALVALGESSGEYGLVATGSEGLARAAIAQGQHRDAAELLGRAGWLRDSQGQPHSMWSSPAMSPTEAQAARSADDAILAAREVLGDEAYAAAADAGALQGLRGKANSPDAQHIGTSDSH
jgi:hypothetical protein